jgi:hypothetical protein
MLASLLPQVNHAEDAAIMRMPGVKQTQSSNQEVKCPGSSDAAPGTSDMASEPHASASSGAGDSSGPEWLSRVREVRVPACEATGPCKARRLAAGLWAGEEYVLQIDAHMR